MENKSIKLCLAFVALTIVGNITGCASIVSSSNKTLPIISQPDEATCEITDVKRGLLISKTKTPHTALLDTSGGFYSSGQYNVKLSKEGYLPYETQIEAGVNGWYFGNIIFGGLLGILIIDPATGAMWKIYEDKIDVKLYKDTPDGRVSMAIEKYNGRDAYKLNDYDQAILDTTRGLTIYPEFYEGYCVRGASYSANGELEKALTDINKDIELRPESPNAYKYLGELNIKMGNNDKALENFNKAIAIKPDYTDALFSRGNLIQKNNKNQAKADISLACKNGYQRACDFQFEQ